MSELCTYLCRAENLHSADRHSQWLNRKTVQVAISMTQTKQLQMFPHVQRERAIDFCIRPQLFDKFHISADWKWCMIKWLGNKYWRTMSQALNARTLTDMTFSSCRNCSLTMFSTKFSVIRLSKFMLKCSRVIWYTKRICSTNHVRINYQWKWVNNRVRYVCSLLVYTENLVVLSAVNRLPILHFNRYATFWMATTINQLFGTLWQLW